MIENFESILFEFFSSKMVLLVGLLLGYVTVVSKMPFFYRLKVITFEFFKVRYGFSF